MPIVAQQNSPPQDTSKTKVRNSIGRDLRSDEEGWLNVVGWSDKNVNQIISTIQGFKNQTRAQAAALGLTLGDGEINELTQSFSLVDPYTQQNFANLITSSLGSLKLKKEQEAFRNPTLNDQQTATAAQLVREELGREGTGDEINFYAKELARGEDPFEIRSFLRQTPDYQEKKAKADRESLNQELLVQEEEAFKRALPEALGSYMRAGRLGSSGLDNAIARQRAELASQRQGYLAQVGREDITSIRNRAFNDYVRRSEPGQQQRLGYAQLPLQNIQNQFGYANNAIQRQQSIQDYEREKSDFDRYLNDSRRTSRQGAWMNLGGSILGAGLQGFTMSRGYRG